MPALSSDVCSRSEEHTSELQSHSHLVCRLLLEKKSISRPPEDLYPFHAPARRVLPLFFALRLSNTPSLFFPVLSSAFRRLSLRMPLRLTALHPPPPPPGCSIPRVAS